MTFLCFGSGNNCFDPGVFYAVGLAIHAMALVCFLGIMAKLFGLYYNLFCFVSNMFTLALAMMGFAFFSFDLCF